MPLWSERTFSLRQPISLACVLTLDIEIVLPGQVDNIIPLVGFNGLDNLAF